MKAFEPSSHRGNQDLGIPPPMRVKLNLKRSRSETKQLSAIPFPKQLSGASAADDSDLSEMLLIAIPVIKQSQAINDACCCALISSFKSCLHGIEATSYSMVTVGALLKKGIYPWRGHLGPLARRAAGCTGTCFIMKTNMIIISKKGTKGMTDITVENGTHTTEKGVWLEANVF